MKYLALATFSCLLTGCLHTTSDYRHTHSFIHQHSVIKTTKEKYPAKNPQNVAFYSQEKTPHTAYRIIGVAKVSKYNLLGMERQTETMQTLMKKLAASVGGDGLINVNNTKEGTEANIIAFQKILI